jgi:hypothetical protein
MWRHLGGASKEMGTMNFLVVKERPARKFDTLTAIYEPAVSNSGIQPLDVVCLHVLQSCWCIIRIIYLRNLQKNKQTNSMALEEWCLLGRYAVWLL